MRPGQVTKAERLTNKLSQFAAFAIQGDYQGCKEFGSDLKKLGLPVEHAPQVSQLFKVGSMNYEDMKQMSMCIEEALFKLNVHRDRALTYKMEEVQLTAVDEIYVEQTYEGIILKQIARVRLFFLGFLSGMPSIELGMNDLWRQGKEVVGRHDIIPVVTEEWIRLEGVEFHACVQQDEYERTRTIKFKPPDACYIELMRFRVRPPKNRELPLQLKATWIVTGNKVFASIIYYSLIKYLIYLKRFNFEQTCWCQVLLLENWDKFLVKTFPFVSQSLNVGFTCSELKSTSATDQ